LIAISTASVLTNREKFAQFKKDFNKTYKSPIEELTRYSIFLTNLKIANRLTASSNGATQYGITQFSDLTQREFSHMYLMNKRPAGPLVEPTTNITITPGLGWDRTCVSPVYNQGQCGSCWAFSATEEIESQMCLQGHTGGKYIQLAMQQIVDCDHTSYGCDGGWTQHAYDYVEKAGGIEYLKDYPYKAVDGRCDFKKADVGAHIKGWSYVGRGDENTMKTHIVNNGPLSICVDASTWQYYQGGVITNNCAKAIDHCVQLVGFDANVQGKQAWYVRNSWGVSWGLSGYLYVEFGHDLCGISSQPTTVNAV